MVVAVVAASVVAPHRGRSACWCLASSVAEGSPEMDPIQLETLESEVWGWLASALSTEGSPLRLPTVATVDAHGVP